MILTEDDYDQFEQHRRYIFERLDIDCFRGDVLVIGSSLNDPHLRRQLREIGRLKTFAGTGRIFVLLHDQDTDRAQVLERMRGVNDVAFGGIDDIMNLLIAKTENIAASTVHDVSISPMLLPANLRSSTIDIVTTANNEQNNPRRLFQGSPASYADIATGLTFRRAIESVLATALRDGKTSATVIGPSGVGKTTAIRRTAYTLAREGFHVWEHNGDFPFRAADWLEAVQILANVQQRAVIVIDDCPRFQRDINNLVDSIVEKRYSNVGLLLSAQTSEWNGRMKSRWIYSRGIVERLRRLEPIDIANLLNLIETQGGIRELVDKPFRDLPPNERETLIKMRAGDDMFVALKYIFASDSLDDILLREYASLSPEMQQIYRYVAAVHATGTPAHRQLLLRSLNLMADRVSDILKSLEDIIQEREVSSIEGIYEWATRHELVAQTIVRYKYFEDEEWSSKLKSIIEDCNPTVYFEQKMLRSLCNSDYGIRRLRSPSQRLALYQLILRIMPTERVAWHRSVYEYLTAGNTGAAESAIRLATQSVGEDPPLHRYRILLVLKRAQAESGLTEEDRRTLIEMAREEALAGITLYNGNRFAFEVLENVAAAWFSLTKSKSMFEEFVPLVRDAAERLLDPELDVVLRRMERGLPASAEETQGGTSAVD